MLYIDIAVAIFLLVAAAMDLTTHKIKNWLILIYLAAAILLFVIYNIHNAASHLLCAGCMVLLGVIGAMGAGDSKLLAVTALLLPYRRFLPVVLGALALAVLYVFVRSPKDFLSKCKSRSGKDGKIVFAPFIFISFMIQYIWGGLL